MTTGIEWTDETWNPLAGCEYASEGCRNCYAARETAGRLSGHKLYAGLAVNTDEGPRFTGEVRLVPERLDQPIRWKRPRMIFVNSMSDLFHHEVPTYFIADVFAVMALAPRHTFQILTKRPARMAALLGTDAFRDAVAAGVDKFQSTHTLLHGLEDVADLPLPNVWLGTSIEDEGAAYRIKALAETPAAVRWVSAEPLIGPLAGLDLGAVDWLVAGGESGRGARPCHPDWLRDLRDRCAAEGVPFLVKQWGEWAPFQQAIAELGHDDDVFMRAQREVEAGSLSIVTHVDPTDPGAMIRVGKHRAGRTLDGVVHDEYPATLVKL